MSSGRLIKNRSVKLISALVRRCHTKAEERLEELLRQRGGDVRDHVREARLCSCALFQDAAALLQQPRERDAGSGHRGVQGSPEPSGFEYECAQEHRISVTQFARADLT